MKTKLLLVAILAMALLVTSVSAGNGIVDLNGKHYNLNIIAVQNQKNMVDDFASGHAMFVLLNNGGERVTTRINLREGPFMLLDKDGTDGVAAFQLPYPYTVFGGTEACYAIWAKALGKPGGSADMYLCQEDKVTFETYCAVGVIPIARPTDGSKNKFIDITRQLTTTSVGALFGDSTENYYWNYENTCSNPEDPSTCLPLLKHAQLRFYQLDTCADAPGF